MEMNKKSSNINTINRINQIYYQKRRDKLPKKVVIQMKRTSAHILGINSAYHESSACLVSNGKLVAAAEEERFNRVKHAKKARVDNPDRLPLEAINFCLREANIEFCEVDCVAYSFNPPERLKNVQTGEDVSEGGWGSSKGEETFYNLLMNIPERVREMAGEPVQFYWIDHHLAHAASAFFVSPFESSAVLSVDGIGEFTTTWLGFGEGNNLNVVKEIHYPNSLGFLWERITKFLGFTEYDAAKIMGLSAYGDPEKYYDAFLQFVTIGSGFTIDNDVTKFRIEDYSGLEALFGKKREKGEPITQRHKDIAAALQKVNEDIILDLAEYLYEETTLENICIAGGVGLNCVTNGILEEKGPFKRIYIQPAANDGGTAIGAAYYVWCSLLHGEREYVMENPFVGPEYSDGEMVEALEKAGLPYTRVENIEEVTASLVAEGNVVAWFQGRMEIGPRALGNRSILADPRNPRMKDILNEKIKYREWFRPFAPSVLEERTKDWFERNCNSLSARFMLFAFKTKDSKKKLIPSVIHVDGTSRVQTVSENFNPRYYWMIRAFEDLTGVPLVLNTSFNSREPIVCSPEDAVRTFVKNKMDYLVLGNFLASRNG